MSQKGKTRTLGQPPANLGNRESIRIRQLHLLTYKIRNKPESIQTPLSSIPDMRAGASPEQRRDQQSPQAHVVSAPGPYIGRDNPNVLSPLQRQLVA